LTKTDYTPIFIYMIKTIFFCLILCLSTLLYSENIKDVSYTYQNSNGNPYMTGFGNLPEADFIDIELDLRPLWISTIVQNDYIYAAVSLFDGKVQVFQIKDQWYRDISHWYDMTTDQGYIPSLLIRTEYVSLIDFPDGEIEHTHPVILSDGTQVNTVEGGLMIGRTFVPASPLPDARILVDDKDRLLFLSDPSKLYNHGVLGDNLEAAGMTIIETDPEISVVSTIGISAPEVIEGIKPIWFDFDGDGEKEILVTLSDGRKGASLVLFDESGQRVANGPSVGLGYRWRHQLAVGPFGTAGETEIVDMLTPHIGGPIEFYQIDGDELRVVASVEGFTSHVMGSRNLDMVAAGDFDGDERPEIIVPTYDRRMLGAIQRTESGAEVKYALDLGARLATNLSAFRYEDGTISLAAGLDNSVLRVWLPVEPVMPEVSVESEESEEQVESVEMEEEVEPVESVE